MIHKLGKSLAPLDKSPKSHKISIIATLVIFASLPVVVFGAMTASSLVSEAAIPPAASNLRQTEGNCRSDGKTGDATFTWNGSSNPPSDFWLDLSVNQNPSQRWDQRSPYFRHYHLRNTRKITTTLPANIVYFWRVWEGVSRKWTYGKSFVVCNSQPTGAPVSGYISSFMGAEHPRGIDIAQSGTMWRSSQIVYATMSGIVTRKSDSYGNYGKTIDIWHPDTKVNGVSRSVLIRYGHFSSLDSSISVGKIIPWGTRLGVWGCTGRCTGTHTHYEIHLGNVNDSPDTLSNKDTGNVVNPLNFNLHRYPCPSKSSAAGSSCVSSPF